MKVYTLSGIGDEDMSGIGRRKRKGFRFAKKLALAPNRRAFRTLVSLNIFGWAKKLKRLNDKRPGKLKDFWERKLGGKYPELMKSIKKGYNHWAKRHHKVKMSGIGEVYDAQMSGIGVAQALPAIIALAAPIAAALIKLFKKEKVSEVEPGEPTLNETAGRTDDYRQQANNGELAGIGRRKGRGAQRVKRLTLAPHRRAFRLAVSLNQFGLAVKLARIAKRDPEQLNRIWTKLGGKYFELMKSVRAGLKRKSARGKKISGIGADAQKNADLGAMIATILKAFAGLFKKHGEPKAGEYTPGESTFSQIMDAADTAAQQYNQPRESAESLVDGGEIDTKGDDSPEGFSIKPVYLIAAGAAALILLKKK